ncbi:MAG: GTPase HflX [Chloroflexi bacterium]|nr:GTPase HflX [Chloroflexota bacterium]
MISDERAFLVGIDIFGDHSLLGVDASLEELAMLADTAGLEVVGQTYQKLTTPNPATFVGSGKVDEVKTWVEELGANVVIFDDELSPRHQRELEERLGDELRVLDRTALILDIFAQHARTREGSLQVELAQYVYRLPRLTRAWTHLVRQTGGSASKGGVGLRGPGETQLEVDRREIRRRIARLERDLVDVRAHRERHRAQRARTGISTIALVGYTNAGKSTLLNRLSESEVYVADQLFATLDPTTRRVALPSGQDVLMTDTVGFIQKLPHSLVAAFRATLEEITEADFLLHVVDASHPQADAQIKAVERTLSQDLEIESIPGLLVLNKIDALEDEQDRETFESLRSAYPDAICISARTGMGVSTLIAALDGALSSMMVPISVRIPYQHGRDISQFYDLADSVEERHFSTYIELSGTLAPRHVGLFDIYRVP